MQTIQFGERRRMAENRREFVREQQAGERVNSMRNGGGGGGNCGALKPTPILPKVSKCSSVKTYY